MVFPDSTVGIRFARSADAYTENIQPFGPGPTKRCAREVRERAVKGVVCPNWFEGNLATTTSGPHKPQNGGER
jgi:hypothetical protein